MSDIDKAKVLAWRHEQVTFAEIARRLGRNVSTVKSLAACAKGDASRLPKSYKKLLGSYEGKGWERRHWHSATPDTANIGSVT